MPPKKKGKNKKDEVALPPPPEPEFSVSDEEEEESERELDLLTDLNDEFFKHANKIILNLMEANRTYEASKIKKYTTIILKLHRKYVEEVQNNELLRPQVERAELKLRLALEISLDSEEIMEVLKKTLEAAWKENDASLFREQDFQAKLQDLLIKCEGLKDNDSKKQDDGSEFGQLGKYKNIILRERDRLNAEVMELEKRLQMQRYYAESLEYINKTAEDTLKKMSTKTRILETEKGTMDLKIRTLMNNIDDQKDTNAKVMYKLDATQKQLSEAHKHLNKRMEDNDRQRVFIEKMRSEALVHTHTISKLEVELNECRHRQKENEETIRVVRLEDKVKGNTINILHKKNKKLTQDYSNMSSKLYKLNRHNHLLADDMGRMKNQINSFEKDLLVAAGRMEDVRRLKDNIQHERDTLRHDVAKLGNQIADLRHTIMLQTNTNDGLHMEINKLNVKLDEAKINISKVSKERDEMAQQMQTLQEQIENYKDQIIMKNEKIADLTEKLQKCNFSLLTIRKQLESLHSEKMMLKRSLETCTQERDDFRVLQTKTNHQIQQLTNEIVDNQNKINSLNLRLDRLQTDIKQLESEVRIRDNQLLAQSNELRDLKTRNNNLLKTIGEDEKRFAKLGMQLDEIRKQKNLVGLQMVRRNDEIVLLKERLAISQTALDQGQTQYNQRVEDIKILKTELVNLQTERDCLSRALKSTADMRQEIVRLQRSLNQERIKVRSLTEDAKTPTGIHRWRILKGEDPAKFQLIEKVQLLQRRNLKQEIEKTNLERQLNEVVHVCDNLKRVVEHLPGQDIKRKLVLQQRINRQQMKKLKSLGAELAIDELELKARECIIHQFKEVLSNSKNSNVQIQNIAIANIEAHCRSVHEDICQSAKSSPMKILENSSARRELSNTEAN